MDGNRDGIAECYCFDADGWMYAGTFTPDGYEVNENGAWVLNEVVQTKSIRGIPVSDSGGGRKNTVDKQMDDEEDYEDVSVSYSANDFKAGNYDMMTTSQIKETEEKIAEFIKNISKQYHE